MNYNLFRRNLARNGKPITLQNRSIIPPVFGKPNFDLDFSDDIDVSALVCTVKGKTFFDGVSIDSAEVPITHEIMIEFLPGVTAETWVLFKNRRIDVLSVENCCEEDEVLVLTCTERGQGEASKA